MEVLLGCLQKAELCRKLEKVSFIRSNYRNQLSVDESRHLARRFANSSLSFTCYGCIGLQTARPLVSPSINVWHVHKSKLELNMKLVGLLKRQKTFGQEVCM